MEILNNKPKKVKLCEESRDRVKEEKLGWLGNRKIFLEDSRERLYA
jgi:hypothetical protein